MAEPLWSDKRIHEAIGYSVVNEVGYVLELAQRVRDEYQAALEVAEAACAEAMAARDERQRALDQLRTMYQAAVNENVRLKKELKELEEQRGKAGWW